jgi:hypothetical protein
MEIPLNCERGYEIRGYPDLDASSDKQKRDKFQTCLSFNIITTVITSAGRTPVHCTKRLLVCHPVFPVSMQEAF